MQTPSHFIMTVALHYPLRRQAIPVGTWGLLLGAVLPDVLFTLLTVVYEIYYRVNNISVPAPSIMEYLHFDLFFNDPVWIIAHNTPHSLDVGSALLTVGYSHYRRGGNRFIF